MAAFIVRSSDAIDVTPKRCGALVFCWALIVGVFVSPGFAQLAPEIGYLFPSGAQRGTTIDLVLGGYDSTSDIQVFFDDPRIKLELTGKPTPVMVPEPPYWFGAKARGPAWPLAREFPARLTIPADVPPGLIRWQIANANGVSPMATLHVGDVGEVVEDESRSSPQVLSDLPLTVSGRIRRIEEIDRYSFQVKKSGLVTVELVARQIESPLHAIVQVREATASGAADGKLLLDVADSEGRDFAVPFLAEAGKTYVVSIHDLDFAGDRSYVYRLNLSNDLRVLAAYPTAGRRGEKRVVEFFGTGIATGAMKLESVKKEVQFPANATETSFAYRLETPQGIARPFLLGLSSIPEKAVETFEKESPTNELLAEFPCAVTSFIQDRFGSHQHRANFKKGEKWIVRAEASVWKSPLDLELSVVGPDGKELMNNDDSAGTTDPSVMVTAAADGEYHITVADRSGKSGSASANYRLVIEPQQEDFSATLPALLGVPLGDKAKLPIRVTRAGGFNGPITIEFKDLPEGVTVPEKLLIAEKSVNLPLEISCDANAAAAAGVATVTASATLNGTAVTKTLGKILIAKTMKPRFKITPEGLDDVRKVHRGSTFLAPLLIEYLEGFEGPFVLEMTSKQQRHRQGLASDEFVVPKNATRVEYPIFVPEWMETTKTSRMILNGTTQIADPKGNVRTLVQRMNLRIGVLPEGALMKLSATVNEPSAVIGKSLQIPLSLSRATLLRDPVEVTFVPTAAQGGKLSAESIILYPDKNNAVVSISIPADAKLIGEQTLTFRASARQNGQWPVVSETTVTATLRQP